MTETREEVQARWWADWWERDFSWAGLAEKPVGKNGDEVHGGLHGERNLQEYWRRDPATGAVRDDAALLAAGELVRAPDGAHWHVVHVPLTWPDATPAKAGWDPALQERLAALLAARVSAARESEVDLWCDAIKADGRAQLEGAVLVRAPTGADGAVPPMVADWAAIPRWDAMWVDIRRGCRFCFAIFSEVSFVSASFFGATNFSSATFCGDASFDSAAFFGAVSFENATFSGEARFHGARFSDVARFDRTSFGGVSRFGSTTFSGNACFGNATFSSDAHFHDATFSGDAYFHDAILSGLALFSSTTFGGMAYFTNVAFSGDARFDRATFSGEARFDGASFCQHLTFATARFHGLAYFTAIKAWPPQASGWHRAFFSTEFARTVDFEGSSLHALAAFDGIRIAQDASLLLDDLADDAAKAVFRQESRAALEQGWRDAKLPDPTQTPRFLRRIRALLRLSSADRKRLHAAQDIRLKELERGCRALVVEMEKLRDRTRAQLFYRFEIEARRRQHETPRWEKITSWLYDKLGDYGASIARPLGWLLLSILLAAPVYGGVLAWQRPALCTERLQKACDNLAKDPRGTLWPVAWGSLGFSASRALPFGAWEVKAEDPEHSNPVRMLLLGEADTLPHLAIRALGTLHSVFALAMAFLSGIAIRRRFQLD